MPGTIGVVNGVAMYTGDGSADGIAYLGVGGLDYSNCRVQMHVLTVEEDVADPSGVALRFRRSDENNYWEFGMSPTSTEYVLRKRVGGIDFTVSEPNLTRGAGDMLRVECYEQRINCYVNETMVISVEDTDLMNNTSVGMRFSAGCVESSVDDFYALVLEDDIRQYLTYFPTYEFYVDWDQDEGLTIGDFETTLDGWVPYGSMPPAISQSDLFVRSGFKSMEIDWIKWAPFQFDVAERGFDQGWFGGPEFANPPNPFKFDQAGQGFDDGAFAVVKVDNSPTTIEANFVAPGVYKVIDKLVPGRTYTLRTWVYTPEFGTHTSIGISGISGVATTSVYNQWEELTYSYVATDTEHTVVIFAAETNPDHIDVSYIDAVMNIGAYEDISCYVIGDRGDITFRYGRDTARSLASIAPGDVELELDNSTQIFSPDNPGSVLAGYLAPGKKMLIRAEYNNQAVNLFHGFVDNYTLHPDPENTSVTMTAMDVLQYLANAKITTELYPSIQTGEAISVILDQIGWPEEKRDIDQGATTMRWWWLDEENGLEAVQQIVESEGMPAIAHVDAFGNFVFKSRHHRFLKTASTSIQGFFRSCAEFDEPNFSGPITYDIGWKDIINQVKVDVDERGANQLDSVWSQDELISIKAGETHTLNVKASDPFFGAILPSTTNGDIELKTGSGALSDVNMTKTSGQSTTITLTAGATDVVVGKIQLRAFSVPVQKTRKVIREESTSVTTYGPQTAGNDFPWAGVNDMDMIAQVILGQRSERLPVVNIKLNNGHPIRISHILNRRLSDRVHLYEMLQTFMDDDYFIEVLEHEISNTGSRHVLTIGCEKARTDLVVDETQAEETPPVFTFDVTGAGFDDGYFTPEGEGFTLANTLFILDQSLLGEDGLGF
jgi:hypothetical protein